MNAIETVDLSTNKKEGFIVPYNMVVRIRKVCNGYHFYDVLGSLHSCDETEYQKYISYLKTK